MKGTFAKIHFALSDDESKEIGFRFELCLLQENEKRAYKNILRYKNIELNQHFDWYKYRKLEHKHANVCA